MVHKKYIKKDGKVFGPYLYENKRVDGKVVTSYVGKNENKNKFTLGIVLVLFLSFVLLSILFGNFSGNAIVDLRPNLSTNTLSGDLRLMIQEGELIPLNSSIQVELGNFKEDYPLSELVVANKLSGNYYVEGKNLQGFGEGYGFIGEKKDYSEISFKLKLIGPVSNADSETSTNQENQENQNNQDVGSENSNNNNNNKYEENEDPEPYGSGGITGNAVKSEESSIKEYTLGYGESVSINIKPGDNIELIKNSVYVNGIPVSSTFLEVKREGGKFIVTSKYNSKEKGFGKEYLGNNTKVLNINLNKLNIPSRDGTLKIKIISQGKTLSESVKVIKNSLSLENVSLIKDITDIRIGYNSEIKINLSEYFQGAQQYLIIGQNLSSNVDGNIMTIVPDNNFKGVVKASIYAYSINANLTSNTFNVFVSSGSIDVKTTRERIKVGEPVKWTKNVNLENLEEINVELPINAEEITVTKVDEQDSRVISVGNVVLEFSVRKEPTIKKFFRGFTGRVISEPEVEDQEALDITLPAEANNYVIEYYTPAPQAHEQAISETEKSVIISGPEEITYTDVIASTNIEDIIAIEDYQKIKIYWNNATIDEVKEVSEVSDNTIIEQEKTLEEAANLGKLEIPFDYYDTDFDGKIDYLEWVVPHLSNQSFTIILITDALHLDAERNAIADIYDYVYADDNNWTSIPEGDYVRVKFERNLTNQNDITIKARSSGGSVEVYEKASNEKIADFGEINEGIIRKIYLTELVGTNDEFDLKVTGNDVEFDYIVDPSIPGNITTCQTLDVAGVYTLNQSITTTQSPCINITASGITLDGNGYSIQGNYGAYGLYASDLQNLSIRNLNITAFQVGFKIEDSSNVNISNVSSLDHTVWGVEFFNITGSNFENIISRTSFSEFGAGILMTNVSNSIFTNIYTQNNFNSLSGIKISLSSSNLFRNITSSNNTYGLRLEDSENNTFINLFTYSNTFNLYDSVSGDPNYLIYNNSFGEIRWTNSSFLLNLTTRGNLTSSNVEIRNNLAFFNSSAFRRERINSSANITLRGNPGIDLESRDIGRNGVACGSGCYNFTSLDAERVIFNVSYWSNYSIIGNVANITPSINFTSPTPSNGSLLNSNNFVINVSSNSSSLSHYTFVDLDRSVVGWWRFDDLNESNGIIDLSSYSNNGSLIGTASVVNSGLFGDSIDLLIEGISNGLSIPQSSSLNLLGSFAVSVWVKNTGYESSGDVDWDQDGHDDTDTGAPIIHKEGLFLLDTRNLFFNFPNDVYYWKTPLSYGPVPAGNWTHVIINYDSTTNNVSIYMNGILNATALYLLEQNSSGLNIGFFDKSGFYSLAYKGFIDDILLFNRSLERDEISSLYNAGLTQYSNSFTATTQNHTIRAYAVNSLGNINSTELRNFDITDVFPPQLNVISPSSRFYYDTNNLSIIIASNENLSSAQFSLDSGISNYSLNLLNATAYNASINVSQGNYSLSIYINDSAGNKNYTNFNFIIDNLPAPIINFTSPTPEEGSTLTETTFSANISTSANASYYSLFGPAYWERGEEDLFEEAFTDTALYGLNPTSTFNGVFGKGLSFDGVNDCMGPLGPFRSTDTVSFWFNPNSYPGNSADDPYSVNLFGGIRLTNASNNHKIEVSAGFSTLWSSNNFVNNTWYHIATVYDGNNISLYVNGNLDNSTACVGICSGSFIVNIGSVCNTDLPGEVYNYFNGTMDELLVFDRSLSSNEISNLYDSSSNNFASFSTSYPGGFTISAYAVDIFGRLSSVNRTLYAIIPSSTSSGGYLSSPGFCTDSDGGQNIYEKGTLRKDYFIESDYCVNSILGEYYCDSNGEGRVSFTNCNCIDGACVKLAKNNSLLLANEDVLSEELRLEIEKQSSTGASDEVIESLICENFENNVKPVSAIASNTYSGYSADNAIDNNIYTSWYGIQSEYPKYIVFDFTNKKCIKSIDLYFSDWDIPVNADIEVSDDGENWKKVISNREFNLQRNLNVRMPETIIARYVRLIENSGARSYGELSEISFYAARYKGNQ